MPLHNHENIGEVQKTAYLVGIVTAVDSEFDTVDFTGVGTCPPGIGIPIFYHCEYEEGEEPALRDNGALEGAAGAFSKDDEVIVQCEITGANRYVPLRVMGFTDKPKQCGFRFKLTRGDETLITEDSGLLTYIRLYNSDNISLSITELIYTPVPKTGEDVDGYWSFNLDDSADADKDGYWVDYLCVDGISTQYPYQYKADDKDKVVDLIPMGAYEDTIPYWKTTSSDSAEGSFIRCGEGNMLEFNFVSGVAWDSAAPIFLFFNGGGVYERKLNIKSSVPYQVTWIARDSSIRTKRAIEREVVANYRTQWEDCCLEPPDLEDCIGPIPETCCWMLDTPYPTCGISNTGGGPFTLVANNINFIITDDPNPEETDTAEFSGDVGGADHVFTISGGGSEPEPSPICGAGYLVYYPGYWPICHDRVCENVGNAPFNYTHWFPGVWNCSSISASYDY